MKILRAVLLCFFCLQTALGCALCSAYSPTAHVQAVFETNSTSINAIKFTWSFSENFSQLTRTNFDLDASSNLEKKELAQIRRSLLDYIVPRHYLTQIEHYKQGEDAQKLVLNLRDYELYFDADRLKFDVSFHTDIALHEGLVVSVQMTDEEGYFQFKFSDENSAKLTPKLWAVPNANANIIFYTLTDAATARAHDAKPSLKSIISSKAGEQNLDEISSKFEDTSKPNLSPADTPSDSPYAQIDAIDEAKFDAISRAGVGFLYRLRELMRGGEQGFSAPWLALLALVSFGYGFLHAAGAGHGKMLTASYFAATGGSYTRAALFALRIGFLHVVGAALFVSAMFALLSGLGAQHVRDAGRITTTASALVIIAVAGFMLYQKLKFRPKSLKFRPATGHKIYPPNLGRFSTHESGCGCAACEFSAWQKTKLINLSHPAGKTLENASQNSSDVFASADLFAQPTTQSLHVKNSTIKIGNFDHSANLEGKESANLELNRDLQNAKKEQSDANLTHSSELAPAAKLLFETNENTFSAELSPKLQNKDLSAQDQSFSQIVTNYEQKTTREWLVAAAAALVPCPGTILVFTLAFELGNWGAGIISGVMMALGMSAVIFVAAVFGAGINRAGSARLGKLKSRAEIIAISLMMGLGVFILVSNFTKVSAF